MHKTRNTFEIKAGVVEAKTTKGQVFWFDVEDLENIFKHTWCVSKTGYLVANIQHRVVKLHRYLLECTQNDRVDHIDGNPLNNTRKNLRICTQAENARNNKLSKNNTTGYPGVDFIKKSGRYRARITVNRKEKNLGHYLTLNEAIEARKSAERKYYKDFAPCDGALKDMLIIPLM